MHTVSFHPAHNVQSTAAVALRGAAATRLLQQQVSSIVSFAAYQHQRDM
jgi:hypothetical protein